MKHAAPPPNKIQADKPAQIDAGARLFLWAFRMMAEHRHCEHPTFPMIKDCYRRFGIEAAAPLLDALVDAFFHTAHTPIAIHSAGCPCVSDEEQFLLRAMAAAQLRDAGVAQRQFERWLPAQAVEWVLDPVCEVGRLFRAAGLAFGPRNPVRAAMAQADEHAWAVVSRAVH
jgi:hypothetical protein